MSRALERASVRLRGVSGFPRAIGRPRRAGALSAPDTAQYAAPEPNHARPALSVEDATGMHWPRLLNLPRAADYLCLGLDVTRELAASGALRAARVTIPAPTTRKRKGGRIALVLLDRLEVDRLVSAWRERP